MKEFALSSRSNVRSSIAPLPGQWMKSSNISGIHHYIIRVWNSCQFNATIKVASNLMIDQIHFWGSWQSQSPHAAKFKPAATSQPTAKSCSNMIVMNSQRYIENISTIFRVGDQTSWNSNPAAKSNTAATSKQLLSPSPFAACKLAAKSINDQKLIWIYPTVKRCEMAPDF